MKVNNKYISEDDLITSYNLARNCDKVFVEAVTHDQFENIKNKYSKILSKNEILIVYKNIRLEICENDIIFCHSNYIHELFYLLKKVNNLKNIKLVTSQSDVKITKKLFNTKPECISEWYGINVDYKHEKLFPIPLGIANNYSPKNLTYANFLGSRKNMNKLRKIYCNYNPNTNNDERKNIKDKFKSNDLLFFDDPDLSFDQYASRLSKYEFVLCPWGNGFDTHRFWETLYSGSIPITKLHHTYSFVPSFSAIFINSYDEINENLLDNFLKNYNQINPDLLTVPYWINLINNSYFESDKSCIISESKLITSYRIYEQLLFFKSASYFKKLKYYFSKIGKLLRKFQ